MSANIPIENVGALEFTVIIKFEIGSHSSS